MLIVPLSSQPYLTYEIIILSCWQNNFVLSIQMSLIVLLGSQHILTYGIFLFH